MKKILLLKLCLLSVFQLLGQTEKGMWLMSGNLFSYGTSSIDRNINAEGLLLNAQSEAGLFLSKRNLVGVRATLLLDKNRVLNPFTNLQEEDLDVFSELSGFYRFYPIPKRRIGCFGELQFSMVGSSLGVESFFEHYKVQFGAGAYFFMTKNLAFEMSLSKPLHQSAGLQNTPDLLVNFSLLRNFKRLPKTRLPRLEDNYLFVRNLYYGLGIARQYKGFTTVPSTQTSLNLGFFLGSHWLFDINYSFEDFGRQFRSNTFGVLNLESAFFIKLNKKGTYLRPAVGFNVEDGSRILRANPDLSGFNKFAYIGSLEIAQFYGDQIIFGGGASMIMTRFGLLADHFQFNANARLTYFITKDFALEYKGAFAVTDNFVNKTNRDLRLTLSRVHAEFKIRHFLFQQ